MQHAYKQDPCPWIGLLILLADPILPDHCILLMFPAANNKEVPFQLPYALAGDKVLFKHNRRYYNVLQGVMVLVASCPNVCVPGLCRICFLQTKEQRIQTQLPQKTLGP